MSAAPPDSRKEKRFHGVGGSPGIAHGAVFLYKPEDEEPAIRRIGDEDMPAEIQRFETALIDTRHQILELQERISHSIGSHDASIFDAHLLVVEDRTLIDEVLRTLQRDKTGVEYVFGQVANRYAKTLSEIDDLYLRERATDIIDVTRRVLRNLMGKKSRDLGSINTPHVLVSHNLTPSDTAQLNRKLVMGFATDIGSRNAHTAIMARSLNIPAVVGLHDLTAHIATGDQVLLDGYNGLLIINPTDQTLWEYGELESRKEEIEQALSQLRETECKTLDGRHVILSANIELEEDVDLVHQSGAEGIGLYRTEFFYMNRPTPPSEEEQYEAYRKVAEKVLPNQIIIRTMDVGGDKPMPSLNLPEETNPFLGWRAIRYCLERPEIFKQQLRAILRASAVGNVRMMYPMISSVDEVRRANALVEECRVELRAEGKAFAEQMEIGAMIEIPSAALSADLIAREVQFFSIGTNDLIQYTVAVDRLNEHIAHLYQPTHPAIIRLIRMIVDAGHAHNLWVGVCGEMAGDVLLTPLLLGLGVDELSTGAALVPRVKRAVQNLDIAICLKLVDEVKHAESPEEVLALCEAVARRFYADLL